MSYILAASPPKPLAFFAVLVYNIIREKTFKNAERVSVMTIIQEQAMQLIQQLPDEKIQAIITLATDELRLMQLDRIEKTARKKAAFAELEQLAEQLSSNIPEDFDADRELSEALEEKYGTADRR
ncbi:MULTISPECIES: hypothetical protein [unclassified Ruminococcus]|uniref:hypothetical protein n=1 Tax=unclassified Ruminococcus TaxID=2608920 RepID=UPI0011143BB1|nr:MULTISPECIES: hypothetical protein [unclassified Ruminococcus]